MRIVSTIGATSTSHDGHDYTPDGDGTFEVPEHVGATLIAFPHWQREYEALDERIATETANSTDPQLQADRIAALEAQVAELQAAATEPTPDPEPDRKGTKPSRS
jgi:hypothetical protein